MNSRKRDTAIYKFIGLKIEKYRKTCDLTQAQLAERIGLTRTSIVHIERGEQKLPIDRLYNIAEALEISVFELLPTQRPSISIDPISELTVSEDARKKVEILLKKQKG